MTNCTKRIPDRAGFVDGKHQPCRWCGKMPEGKRKTFCSDECIHQHKLRTQPAYQSEHVFERDKGVCCGCGIDTEAIRESLRVAAREDWRAYLLEGNFSYPCWQWERRPFGDPTPKPRACGHDACLDRATAHQSTIDSWRMRSRHAAIVSAHAIPRHLHDARRRCWEMDHIVPVIEGGGDCGLENLRTLCWACHARETKALAARRAEKRKAEKSRLEP
jgi:5-methylcytosine-specific restriction enzyme A